MTIKFLSRFALVILLITINLSGRSQDSLKWGLIPSFQNEGVIEESCGELQLIPAEEKFNSPLRSGHPDIKITTTGNERYITEKQAVSLKSSQIDNPGKEKRNGRGDGYLYLLAG